MNTFKLAVYKVVFTSPVTLTDEQGEELSKTVDAQMNEAVDQLKLLFPELEVTLED